MEFDMTNGVIDPLTGLLSGADIDARMEALINKGGEFAFIVADIDNLSETNDKFGIEAGDAVFRLIAKHITEVFPSPCSAFRNKGDEHYIILQDMGKEEAFLKAECLRKLICDAKLDYSDKDGARLSQSVSIGVSSYPEDGSRPADISRRAVGAMIRAKKNGRNCVCLAREEKLMPKTSHYTQTQLEKLSDISEKLGVGESALLRESLDDLLRKYDS
jgi:diguanylate cyclase (GGDEF)-like protein